MTKREVDGVVHVFMERTTDAPNFAYVRADGEMTYVGGSVGWWWACWERYNCVPSCTCCNCPKVSAGALTDEPVSCVICMTEAL